MRRLQRAAAWALCAALLVSDQGTQALAAQPLYHMAEGTEREEAPGGRKPEAATPSQAEEGTERIEALLPLRPLEAIEWDGEAAVYWNPGKPAEWEDETATPSLAYHKKEQEETATPSAADQATPSDAERIPQGSDRADGLTPGRPVKSLKAAMNKAKKLAKALDVETEEVVIYAMNPMEIGEGEAYFLDGKGMTILAWDGRDYDSDLIFYVDGGQLSLEDVRLQPSGGAGSEASAAVVQANGGKVQLGERVELSGTVALNYQEIKETPEWLTEATPADAKEEPEAASEADARETVRIAPANEAAAPVVELLKDFEGEYGPYYLDVQADEELESVELVRSLYADDSTADEFMGQFYFSDTTDIRWEMEVYQEEQGIVRKARSAAVLNGEEEQEDEENRESLTKKHLVARASEGEFIYWNPGAAVEINGISYGEGNDANGGIPSHPVKTWSKALAMVKDIGNGTILAVQSLNLDEQGEALEYLGDEQAGDQGTDGYTYVLDGNSAAGIPVRSVSGTAVFPVEEGVTARFSDLIFTGERNSETDGAQAVETTGGRIVLEDNVKTENAFLQVNLEKEDNAQEIPVEVCSGNVEVTLYFGGINDNLNKRFLDVVVPGGELRAAIDGKAMTEDEAGRLLLENISLAEANQGEGKGVYTWRLRQDTALDDTVEDLENLELYTDYYYDAVYLDGQRGNDIWLGASCLYPVKTFEQAKKILAREMEVSKKARQEAAELGNDPGSIAMPTKIYICGTVEIAGTEDWTLPEYTDYDGITPVEVEIVSHGEKIAVGQDGTPVHEKPEVLVRVPGNGGNLTLGNGITIRNITDLKDSATVDVLAGGNLTLTGDALLTGAAAGTEAATRGFHVRAGSAAKDGTGPASVVMTADWTGAVELRGIGIYAAGAGTTIRMAGGSVRKNQSASIGTNSHPQFYSTLEDGYGAGIVCGDGAAFEMAGGSISENTSAYGGTGVLAGDRCAAVMTKGEISGNQTLVGRADSYGGGVYVRGEGAAFVLGTEEGSPDDCRISGNFVQSNANGDYTGKGGGIAADGNGASFTMYSGTVENNSASAMTGLGGGLYLGENASARIYGGAFKSNQTNGSSASHGGGIYNAAKDTVIENAAFTGNHAENGAGVYSSADNASMKGLTVSQNTASKYGGGLFLSGNAVLRESLVENNTALLGGGGIYAGESVAEDEPAASGGIAVIEAAQIKGNHAQDGGGVYGGGAYWNTQITGNTADGKGGGVYLNDQETFQLSETRTSGSALSGNRAKQGGGLYSEYKNGTAYLALSGQVQNTAKEQGNNLVLTKGTVYLLEGVFLQPKTAEDGASDSEGIYNIYLSREAGDTGKFYIDPARVTVESGGREGEPRAIYLDSPDSYLTYLSAPSQADGSLPITLNQKNFAVGSTAARPAGEVSFSLTPPPAQETVRLLRALSGDSSYSYRCDTASGIKADGSDFHAGSVTPVRTQLGGFTSASNRTDLVLVGQGIYLDGSRGDNENSGLSPDEAVADFKTAKGRLTRQVNEANEDKSGEGFAPFIYISGPVAVNSSEIWELDPEEEPFKGSQYEAYESQQGRTPEKAQVRRFASFVSKPMVTINSGASVTAEDLTVNGMKDSVITTEQLDQSPAFKIVGGALTLQGNAVVRDNYYNLIHMTGGMLTLDGEGADQDFNQLEIRSHGYGVYAIDGAKIQMENGARIYMENANGSSVSDGSGYEADSPDEFWQGVILDAGSEMTVKDSFILQENQEEKESLKGIGVVMGTLSGEKRPQSLVLDGTSKISGFGKAVGLKPYGARITLKGSSALTGNASGIEAPGGTERKAAGNIQIQMEETSAIREAAKGIAINDSGNDGNDFLNNLDGKISISLNGEAKIVSCTDSGIYTLNNENYFEFQMEGSSSISENNSGIFCDGVESSMGGRISIGGESSVISKNAQYGIYLDSGANNKCGKLSVILEDQAEISENGYDNGTSGGIYVSQTDCEIKMKDSARLYQNGKSSSSGDDGGIVFNLMPYRSNTYKGSVSLEDSAAVESSWGPGIFQKFTAGSSDSNRGTLKVSLSGNSSIKGSQEEDILMEAGLSELRLSDEAAVGAETADEDRDNVVLRCPLYLEGTADINGMVYLKNAEAPIVMTKLASETETEGKFRLHLAEGFVGQKVVIPQNEDERYPEYAGTTDISGQISFFLKAKGEGLAGDSQRFLRPEKNYIILAGENNVYLSGMGDDSNNGLTPDTAVRTFKRAKELLEGDGYFEAGANILISSGVRVMEEDTLWSFDENGQVTNRQTGATWKPVVKKYEGFLGVTASSNSHLLNSNGMDVRLEHITIGDSEFDYDKDTNGLGVFYIRDGSVTLGEGAVLTGIQGMNYGSSGQSVIYVLGGGTFAMEGGSIQDCSLEGEDNKFIGISSGGILKIDSGEIRGNNLTDNSLLNVKNGRASVSGGTIQDNQTESALIQFEGSTEAELSGGAVEANRSADGTIKVIDEASLSITGGSIRNNVSEGRYPAIQYGSDVGISQGILEISGGIISGNTTKANGGQAIGQYAPVYIAGPDFRLKGGGANIADAIYLADTDSVITLSGPIYQKDRTYTVYLKQTGDKAFKPGSAVVQPDNNRLVDATPYLGNFSVMSAPYILDQGQAEKNAENGNRDRMENQCLILMKAVFVDSEAGDDENSGAHPAEAVRTFEKAKELGGQDSLRPGNEYYVIYASGPVDVLKGGIWTLPETAYLCRYTGFAVYDENGAPVLPDGEGKGYTGELIRVKAGASLQMGGEDGGILIYGRRGIDSDTYNGDSLVLVESGGSLRIQDALLARNNNTGTMSGDYEDPVSGNGGGVRVMEDGSLTVSGGSLTGLEAVRGAAVYVQGTILLENDPLIQGDIYLARKPSGIGEETYIQAAAGYRPSGYSENDRTNKLSVRVEDDFGGRKVIQYPDNAAPTPKEMEYYLLEDYILSVYDFLQNPDKLWELTLQKRQAYFLDGEEGSDENTGRTPAQALKSLKGLYEKLNRNQETAGVVVYVVNGMTVDQEAIVLSNYMYQTTEGGAAKRVYRGSYQGGEDFISVSTQVTFMRYVRPENAEQAAGFENAKTCPGPLFAVTGSGSLSLNGVYLDGGLNGATYLIEDASGGESRLTAGSCENAKGPLVSVSGENASLDLSQVTDGQIAAGDSEEFVTRIRTTLRNNQNLRDKSRENGNEDYELGELDGKMVYEGSSAGVEILEDASCRLHYTEFSNLSIGGTVTGGADVYDNGKLTIAGSVHITGSIFLEGQGKEDDEAAQNTSRFIQAEMTGNNWEEPFQLKMRDPYFTRTMVEYPTDINDTSTSSMVGYYILEEAVNDYFRIGVRESDGKIYELTPPPAVYIDGVNGRDEFSEDEEGRLLGVSPKYAVKTMAKAYELMKNRAVNILYVVNTVTVTKEASLTNNAYYDTDMLEETGLQNHLKDVEIRRYVKPVTKDENYDVDSFENGPLFKVAAGGSLRIQTEDGYSVDIDGHKNSRTNPQESEKYRTEHGAEATAPLIEVEEGGSLTLAGAGTVLHDNKNITGTETGGLFGFFQRTAEGTEGGAVKNSGSLTFEGAVFEENEALNGAGIYQDNELLISREQPEGLRGQEIFLTSEAEEAVENGERAGGEDHVITSDILLEESFKENTLSLNMDHAVKGRHVVVYSGYSQVDEQHDRYHLGKTVPEELFLVESPDVGEDNILELQNWEMLDVTVPDEIFLAVKAKGSGAEIADGASSGAKLDSPEYEITNNSPLAVKVSLTGFTDTSEEAEIDQDAYGGAMNLVGEAEQAAGERDLYLAVAGLDGGEDPSGGSNPFGGLAETALSGYTAEGASSLEMGVLEKGQTGTFTFTGTASKEFVSHYLDPEFPFEGDGDLSQLRKDHYRSKDEETGEVNAKSARARYQMSYRIELAVPRREEGGLDVKE